jgi:hypothetical protein
VFDGVGVAGRRAVADVQASSGVEGAAAVCFAELCTLDGVVFAAGAGGRCGGAGCHNGASFMRHYTRPGRVKKAGDCLALAGGLLVWGGCRKRKTHFRFNIVKYITILTIALATIYTSVWFFALRVSYGDRFGRSGFRITHSSELTLQITYVVQSHSKMEKGGTI